MAESEPTTPSGPSSRWLVLIPLLLGILGSSLSMSLIAVPAPVIAAEVSLSDTGRAWLVDSYPLCLAAGLLFAARLGDRFGRRTVLVIGLGAMALGNAVAMLASAGLVLIITRAITGLAGGAVIASVVATIGTRFRGRDLAIANGAWVATVGAGNALGPVLGGVLTDRLGWRSVFAALVAIASIAALAAIRLLPESRGAGRPGFDPVDLILSGVGLGVIVHAVKRLAAAPVEGTGLLVIGVALLAVFVRRQRRATDPLLDVALFARRRVSVSAIQLLISAAAAGACIYLVSVHLQLAEDRSPSQAGLALVPLALATTAGGLLAPLTHARLGSALVVRIALGVQAAGALATGLGVVPLPAALALVGLGYGAVGTIATTALFEAATPRRAAQAGVIQEIAFAVGTGLGIAAFSTVAAIDPVLGFRIALVAAAATALGAALLPTGVPTGTHSAADDRPSQ